MSSEQILVDDLPIGKFHIRTMALTFGAHLNDGYILGLAGMAFTLLIPDMKLNTFWQGVIGSSALFGLFLGSLISGIFSDRFGRQKIFNYSFVLIVLGSFLQFFCDSPLTLTLCRVLVGIGIGGDYSVGHAILAEFCPRKHRGVILGSFSVIWTFGYVMATFVGLWMISLNLGDDTWRYILASSTIPAVVILIARIGFPESPRWLVNQGRHAEAEAILHKCLGPNVILGDENVDESHSGFKALFSKKYLNRTLFNCIFFACIVMPYFAIYTFLPMILDVMGLSAGFTTEMLLNGMLILGALIGIGCTIIFSRRGFLIGSFIILTITLFVLAILPPSLHVPMVLLFALFTVTLSAVSNLVGVFPAESFPTEVRSSGIGLATSMSRLGSVVSTFLLPGFMANLGVSATMITLSGVLLFGAIISFLWAPETKTLTLAQAGQVQAG